jgi:SAM-dependent methyltransferase
LELAKSEVRELAKRIPGLRALVQQLRTLPHTLTPRGRVFDRIYARNAWGHWESASGEGSSLVQTQRIRQELPALWRRYSVRRVLDAPCGDFHWMKEIATDLDEYVGVDIVAALIEANTRRYGNARIRFQRADLVKGALPGLELILCRDCLVHLSFRDIQRALANMKRSGARYLLTTTFTERTSNVDILTGQWRPLNLERAPLNFPPVIEILNEGCTQLGGEYVDKSLGLWRLADLPEV